MPVVTGDNPSFLLNMDFGGAGGTRLGLLTRISAFHDDRRGCVRGFAFFYADGSSINYGTRDVICSATERWTCVEQSAAIDGLRGERIVDVLWDLSEVHIQGVKVTVITFF